MIRLIIFAILFAVTGEILIKADKAYKILESNRLVKIPMDHLAKEKEGLPPDSISAREPKPVFGTDYESVKPEGFEIDSTDLRIMVLGDSYIRGGGVRYVNSFTPVLESLLSSSDNGYKKVWMLDLARVNYNTLDNYVAYREHVDWFQPGIVVLGYNINDVEGNLEEKAVSTVSTPEKIDTPPAQPATIEPGILERIKAVLYNSDLLQYSLYNIHREMKTYGYTFPNSRFDLKLKAYYQEHNNWKKSKEILDNLIADTQRRNIAVIVYYLPEMNLIELDKLFEKSDRVIQSYFEDHDHITYLDGRKMLDEFDASDVIISKYDGHPNSTAHRAIAGHVADVISRGTGRR